MMLGYMYTAWYPYERYKIEAWMKYGLQGKVKLVLAQTIYNLYK